jgi:hypothetical protein
VAKISGRLSGRATTRLAAAAITAALVGTGASAFAAEVGDAPMYGITGVDSTGASYYYAPNGEGGLQARVPFDTGWKDTKFLGLVDSNADSLPDGRWQTNAAGALSYAANDNSGLRNVGHGWGIYNKLVSAGNVGGGEAGDLLGRDAAGNLYLYLGYGDGTVTQRYKVGGGWNAYNTVFAPGDIDLDGRTDLIGRDAVGALYLYKGTGKAAAPYGARVQIGTGGWNTYRLIF